MAAPFHDGTMKGPKGFKETISRYLLDHRNLSFFHPLLFFRSYDIRSFLSLSLSLSLSIYLSLSLSLFLWYFYIDLHFWKKYGAYINSLLKLNIEIEMLNIIGYYILLDYILNAHSRGFQEQSGSRQ